MNGSNISLGEVDKCWTGTRTPDPGTLVINLTSKRAATPRTWKLVLTIDVGWRVFRPGS